MVVDVWVFLVLVYGESFGWVCGVVGSSVGGSICFRLAGGIVWNVSGLSGFAWLVENG